MVSIQRLFLHDTEAIRQWDCFVDSCPEATFFHRAGWQRIFEEVFRHDSYYFFAHRDGVVEGVLPLVHVKSLLFGNSLVSLPFAVYGGVASLSSSATHALEQEAQALALRLGVSHLEMRCRKQRHADWPGQELYVTFRKALLPSDEENLLAIPRKQRAMVRKGTKNGLKSRLDSNLDSFFGLYADNMLRHGTPALSRRYFEAVVATFGDDCDVLTITDQTGRPVSSVMSFYFKEDVLPYYAGDHVEARDLAANDFKYWELMRHAVKRGKTVFDYGRSKKGTGSFAFKKNWGFEPEQLHYEFCLYKRDDVPQNNPANAKYRLLIETWKHLPLGLANWLGPKVVRSLG